ncbi:MAG: hypothetical protein JWP44_504 [Mucilaginibacter sp.]|nr:hypothetical protein [Mucilaginibacter sp.]
MLLTSNIISNAQELKPNTTIKTSSASFVVHQPQPGGLVVYNNKNSYDKKIPKVAPTTITIVGRRDKGGMLNSFKKVFSNDRLKQLLPENILPMQLYVDSSGGVLEIVFFLNNNTLVKAQELDDLEKAIKANVSLILNPNETKGGDFFAISVVVKYSRVLDGTLK